MHAKDPAGAGVGHELDRTSGVAVGEGPGMFSSCSAWDATSWPAAWASASVMPALASTGSVNAGT